MDANLPARAIVPQIEAYCERQGILLQPCWRADLALDVQRRAMRKPDSIPLKAMDRWQSLFELIATTEFNGSVRPADGTTFEQWTQEKAALLN